MTENRKHSSTDHHPAHRTHRQKADKRHDLYRPCPFQRENARETMEDKIKRLLRNEFSKM